MAVYLFTRGLSLLHRACKISVLVLSATMKKHTPKCWWNDSGCTVVKNVKFSSYSNMNHWCNADNCIAYSSLLHSYKIRESMWFPKQNLGLGCWEFWVSYFGGWELYLAPERRKMVRCYISLGLSFSEKCLGVISLQKAKPEEKLN